MKNYNVFLSNDRITVNKDMSSTNKVLAKKCKNIESLINSDYEMQEPDVEYGELHSIVELTNDDEKNLLTIFQKEVNNVEFVLEDDTKSYDYELSNQELKYINDFKEVIIEERIFFVKDISYDLDKKIIKVIIRNK